MARRRSKGLVVGLPAKALYEHYGEALSRYLKRRVRRPEDVADLTQEIFELFVRRKERAEVIRNPLAYLFRIAFHVVGTSLTDEKRNPVTFDSELLAGDLAANPPRSSGEDAEDLAVQEDVKGALAKLPKSHLTALLMVEGQGLSYKEAAHISGFTPTTIASYVMRARATLKLALDDARDKRAGGKGAIHK
jgi:RNA polymerase sigma factor (sigma-70 family)